MNVTWTEKNQKAFARPTRNILPGLNVYLGDLTKYDVSEQPYIFTVDVKPYEEAKSIFGKWDRWKSVPRKLVQVDESLSVTFAYNPNWRLIESREDYVEIIRYQDKWNNEFAVILNGVLMTPIGLPLPWGYEDYNIVQQNLEPIHAKFAYGKSLVARIRNKAALLDELLKLAVLKTQKSFMPPYVNISGRVLSNRVLMPAKITYGIQPNTLVPINDKEAQGINQAEFAMIQEIQESINSETTSPTFQGQQAEGNPTATEIIELQRQAKMVLGLTVFSVSMLEWKLEWLRLKNILAHWFSPEDQVVDEARGILKSRFRQVSVERSVEGEGMGRRIIVPTEQIPSPEAIMQAEDALGREQGVPIRLIFLNPSEVTKAQLVWQITVRPKERKTSEVSKLMFREEMLDIMPLQPNFQYLQERAASVWEEDPRKLFAPNPMQPGMEGEMAGAGAQGTMPTSSVNLPSPGGALNRNIKTQMGANA